MHQEMCHRLIKHRTRAHVTLKLLEAFIWNLELQLRHIAPFGGSELTSTEALDDSVRFPSVVAEQEPNGTSLTQFSRNELLQQTAMISSHLSTSLQQ